jgi:predicted phosphodiesterase
MIAIVSDLHSNIEATEVVLEDAAANGAESIYCLGDVIGYGPNPREVLAKAKAFKVILMGNHEEGLLHFAEDFNQRAREALDWTRDQLNDASFDRDENDGFWEMLDGLPKVVRNGNAMFVHGSLRQATRDYVMPSDASDSVKMGEIFGAMDRNICFFGHTHVPGVWVEDGHYLSPYDVDGVYRLKDDRVLVNVGSVGQPRDGDSRASYVLFDGERVQFRRLKYDFETTMEKILSIDRLDDMLGLRLKMGR